MKVCRCGHLRSTHTHYRAGADCGACGPRCPRYRAPRWTCRARTWLAQLRDDLVADLLAALGIVSPSRSWAGHSPPYTAFLRSVHEASTAARWAIVDALAAQEKAQTRSAL